MVKEELLKKIRDLGFKVGYYGHDEFASWVWRKRKELLDEASKIGISEQAKQAYEEGKELGHRQRIFDERKKKEKKLSEKRKREEILIKLELEREEFLNSNDPIVVASPKNIEKPRIIEKPKFIETPRILRRFFSLWD